ncbi:T9SS type A sorting domain-containing protein [bacterium]|nr:T9SS type A sorting domain-containing protein [bacterium]
MRLPLSLLAATLILLLLVPGTSGQPISGFAHDMLTCVDATPDGLYLAGGYSSSFGVGETAAIVCLLDASGQTRWVMDHDTEWWDETADVMADLSGRYWLAGATRPNEGLFDWLVCKFDAHGRTLWSRIYFEDYPSAAVSLVSDGEDGAYVLGFVEIDDVKQVGLLHLAADGDVLWTYTSEFVEHHDPSSLARTPAGNLIVASQQNANDDFASDIHVLSFDRDGAPLWDYLHAQPWVQRCAGVDVTTAGEILVAGSTVADTVSEETDGMLLKLSPAGKLLWERQSEHAGRDRWLDVTIVTGDSALVCGVEQDPVTLSKRAVLKLLALDGSSVWKRSYSFQQHAEFTAITGSSSAEFMAVGFADPDEPWMTDYLIASATGVSANVPAQLPATMQLLAYPNPANSRMRLEFTISRSSDMIITLSNVLGQRVSTIAFGRFTAGTHRLPVSLHQLASGNYFVEVTGSDVQSTPLRVVVVK